MQHRVGTALRLQPVAPERSEETKLGGGGAAIVCDQWLIAPPPPPPSFVCSEYSGATASSRLDGLTYI